MFLTNGRGWESELRQWWCESGDVVDARLFDFNEGASLYAVELMACGDWCEPGGPSYEDVFDAYYQEYFDV
tara:strand:- start:557 stop:769 length:213 start_codon:yes stop_codon:yes gene_type:complete